MNERNNAAMMADMHTHIIWGVDDGAATREETIAMLRREADDGVTDVFCTSHIAPGYQPFPSREYADHLAEARAWCMENLSGLRLHPGSEIFWTEHTLRMLDEGKVPTLAGTRWVLVEYNPDESEKNILDSVRELARHGYRAVIAHAERYEALRYKTQRLRGLKEETGALVQMNGRTVAALRDRKLLRPWPLVMLREGLVDRVASDAHNMDMRCPCMGEATAWLAGHLGPEAADALCGGILTDI